MVRRGMRLASLIGPELLELVEETPEELLGVLDEIHPEDMAEICTDLDEDRFSRLIANLPPDYLAELLPRLPEERQAELTEILGARSVALIATEMAADDRADFFSVLPASLGAPVLEELGRVDPEVAEDVEALVQWPADSAGGLMTTDYLTVPAKIRLSQAIEEIRKDADRAETVDSVYVVDSEGRLLGVLTLRQLLLSKPEQAVEEVMLEHVISVRPETDQEQVAKVLGKYDLHTLPVVGENGMLLGLITSDDVFDVIAEEQAEDAQKMGGMEALDAPYLKIGFTSMVKKRAGWLAALFLGEMLTATAMAFFEDEIARAVVLALFVPLIISSGGNSGSQASTLVIRAMALDEVRLGDWWRVIRRELGAGLVLGLVLGTIGLFRILVWQAVSPTYGEHYVLVALTVFGSLIGVVTFGTLAGSLLPFILRRLGFDPASASAPFVATLVDVTGLVIYFSVASTLLRGTLL
jgi:magnesium transporter